MGSVFGHMCALLIKHVCFEHVFIRMFLCSAGPLYGRCMHGAMHHHIYGVGLVDSPVLCIFAIVILLVMSGASVICSAQVY
jgi:hypothetical protein